MLGKWFFTNIMTFFLLRRVEKLTRNAVKGYLTFVDDAHLCYSIIVHTFRRVLFSADVNAKHLGLQHYMWPLVYSFIQPCMESLLGKYLICTLQLSFVKKVQ